MIPIMAEVKTGSIGSPSIQTVHDTRTERYRIGRWASGKLWLSDQMWSSPELAAMERDRRNDSEDFGEDAVRYEVFREETQRWITVIRDC